MKSNEMHAREVDDMRREVERERREMLRERDMWQKEMDRMHKLEMDNLEADKDIVLREQNLQLQNNGVAGTNGLIDLKQQYGAQGN